MSAALLLLVVGVWGGLQWYTAQQAQRLAVLDETLRQANERLRGKEAERVVDFDTRLGYVSNHLTDRVASAALLKQLEKLVISGVVLTQYEYNREEKVVTVSGLTDDFKYLAQQVVALKAETPFAAIRVDSVTRTKEGKISFTLKAHFSE